MDRVQADESWRAREPVEVQGERRVWYLIGVEFFDCDECWAVEEDCIPVGVEGDYLSEAETQEVGGVGIVDCETFGIGANIY